MENDDNKGKKKAQVDELLTVVAEDGILFFRDENREPYTHFEIKGHYETCAVKSSEFKRALAWKFWEKFDKYPQRDALLGAITLLEAKAIYEGPTFPLSNRIGKMSSTYFYDLADRTRKAVAISADGWKIIEMLPAPLFRHFSHQKPQILPVPGGNLWDIFAFINIHDPDQQLLLIVYIVSCFIPDIPHPVIMFHGTQGSAKTTTLRLCAKIIDPSATEVLSFPKNHADLVQMLSHHWFVAFDNLTTLTDAHSDTLCRAVTCEGFSKRRLYSDDDDVIYSFRRAIGLNGINIAAQKPDLLDRGLIFELERITPNDRKDEKEFWEAFDERKPQFLGAIFDGLVSALRILPTVKLTELPRMADFARHGFAIAEAIGSSGEAFLRAYAKNRDTQNDVAIQENPLADALLILMDTREQWEGTPVELLEALNTLAAREKIDTADKTWPTAANWLTRRLNLIKHNLEEKGIKINTKMGRGQRFIELKRVISADTDGDVNNGKNSISEHVEQHSTPNEQSFTTESLFTGD